MSDLEQRLREAMDGVTPGPWVAEQSMSRKYLDAVLFQYQSGIKGTVALIGKEAAQVGASELDEQNANSAYIALCSPNNISALLDTIASLRSKLEEAEGALAQALMPFLSRALVATPPAERVEETLTPDIYSQAWRDQMDKLITDDMVILALDAVDPDWNDEFSKAKARSNSRNWMRKVLRITIPIAAALATKPAVKDDEAVVEALPNWNGWRSIDTAPEDCRVILATAGGWVGEAIMLRDEDTGEQVWTWVDTGKPSLHSCYGWMPLPAPLVAPVLSDLRPDGFDGPTGAE